MSNRLANETSPYLLQHKDNPVDWYPWGKEAFERAKREDKPIFLSIGYSACHWCHVLARESFEDEEISALLNKYFVSVKVDKEERPDIDSVYMAVCQAFTGSGGWPTSIFMTAEGKPFFAGTYFPRTSRGGMIGMRELLLAIGEKWVGDRDTLLGQSDEIIKHIEKNEEALAASDTEPLGLAAEQYARRYDEKYGGFGRAPKFPTPHNLLFLLEYYERYKNAACLNMAERTLLQMYRGGIFDHVGFGFCRYSTDRKFLVPHFEKMLYDNALLILAYTKAYAVTKKPLYLEIAEKTAKYILDEMTSDEGSFYSSQDADSEGEEGKYYLFRACEVTRILGEERGAVFNRHYGITASGNFEGKNIPNLLESDPSDKTCEQFLPTINAYRKKRYTLHRDEKILTSWNSLAITAMCEIYLVSGNEVYLTAAKSAELFLRKNLSDSERLYVSFYGGKRGARGFLDDYASYILANLSLYRATLEENYLNSARHWCGKVLSDFADNTGGFYLYGNEHEELLLRPKETYDGAIPSGNSLMAYNLVRLYLITGEEGYRIEAERQQDFLLKYASRYPANHAMFLRAFLDYSKPPTKITVITDGQSDIAKLPLILSADAVVLLLQKPTEDYRLKNGKTTYYVCRGSTCFAPTNDLNEVILREKGVIEMKEKENPETKRKSGEHKPLTDPSKIKGKIEVTDTRERKDGPGGN